MTRAIFIQLSYKLLFFGFVVHSCNAEPCPDTQVGDHVRCGCHDGTCWKYDGESKEVGDSWCYTQVLGEIEPMKNWKHCRSQWDCDSSMTCGSASRYRGNAGRSIADQHKSQTVAQATLDSRITVKTNPSSQGITSSENSLLLTMFAIAFIFVTTF